MNTLFKLILMIPLGNNVFCQSYADHQLINPKNLTTSTIDSVIQGENLTAQQLASFKILSSPYSGENFELDKHLISFDMFKHIEAARDHKADVTLKYNGYTILVYRKKLGKEESQ